jgi:alanyl-tRNA synthetase
MTKKLYDQDSHLSVFSATVLSCQPAGDGAWAIVLDQTAFFPEGGGQDADRGTLGSTHVVDVQETPLGIVHTTDSPLPVGETVTGRLDWPLRFRRMQCHSGEHIISGTAHSLFGCTNVGFHLGDQEVILDFDKELTPDQIRQVEDIANQVITENRPVLAEYPPEDTLKDLEYRSKLDLTENVRIVTIPGCDVCACCAPHVSATGEIGLVKIVNSMRHRGGIRLWMVAGRQAVEDYRAKHESVAAISAALSVKQEEVTQGVERLKNELAQVSFQLKEARQALMAEKAKALPETDGNLVLFQEDLDAQSLRTLANAGMEKCSGICAVFTGSDKAGYRYVMGSKAVDLRAKAKEFHTALGGKGGGQPTMIQGSVPASRADLEDYF